MYEGVEFFLIKKMRQPGVEPGSTAWKATMLTATPLTLHVFGDGQQA